MESEYIWYLLVIGTHLALLMNFSANLVILSS